MIATHDFEFDLKLLRHALHKGSSYVGMIGAQTRRELMESQLTEGEREMAKNVWHCPVGLQVGGRQPHEIALSIVAQLQQTASRGASTHLSSSKVGSVGSSSKKHPLDYRWLHFFAAFSEQAH